MVISYEKDSFPDWAEVQFCKKISLLKGQETEIVRQFQEGIIFILKGDVIIQTNSRKTALSKGNYQSLAYNKTLIIANFPAELLVICGNWGINRGTCGIFTLASTNEPCNGGDPANYPRNTVFDKHYHDCDEYWFIVEGRGVIVIDERSTNVQSGDCVITRAGHTHDFPWVTETIRGVWFEGSMIGQKKPGHLYRYI